jgi:hypothetical protein
VTKIHARIPKNLQGSAFHCPAYIEKLSHFKHEYYSKNEKVLIFR